MADSAIDRRLRGYSAVSGMVKPGSKRAGNLYWMSVALVIALGVWVRSPALTGTRISDDWDHYAMVSGVYPLQRSAFDLYDFIGADPRDRVALTDSGRLPWWSDPKIRISFFRPLASFWTYADYAWFGAKNAPARAHAHSLVWWVLSLVAAAGVLRLIFPASIALLALLLFALDEGHSLPVAWSASRAEVIASALMLSSLWAFMVWMAGGGARFRWLAVFLTVLALLAGEHALSLFPYLALFAAVGCSGSLRERVLRVVPFVVPVLGYLIAHVAFGYGVEGSSFYSDPFGDLPGYLSVLPQRISWLLADLIWGYSADWSFMAPPWSFWLGQRGVPQEWLSHENILAVQTSLGALAAVCGIVTWIALYRRRDDRDAAQVCWLLLAAAASLLPVSSAFAMTRLTVAPALGIDACWAFLLARSISALRAPAAGALPRVGCTLAACAILALHVVLPSVRSRDASAMYAAWSIAEEAWVKRARFEVPSLAGRRVFVLSAHDTASQYALPYLLHLHGFAIPSSSQILLPPALTPLELNRPEDNVLELSSSAPGGHFGFLNSAYRRSEASFVVGQRRSNPHFDVEVTRVVGGVPASVRFTFPRSLDDASYVFMYPQADALKRIALPRIGEARVVPAPAVPTASDGLGH